MVRMLASSVEDQGFDCRQCQIRDYTRGSPESGYLWTVLVHMVSEKNTQ